MCMEVLNRMTQLWENGDDEDRQGMVRNLFQEIVYDLEKQQLVEFRLKPWADRFLTLRAELYEVDRGEIKTANLNGLQHQMPHTGIKPTSRYTLQEAVRYFTHWLNHQKNTPHPRHAKPERNAQIIALYQAGKTLTEIAQAFHISEQRVHQIIHHKTRNARTHQI